MTGEAYFHYSPAFDTLRLLTTTIITEIISFIFMLNNHSRNNLPVTLKSLQITTWRQEESYSLHRAGRTPVLPFLANLAVTGDSSHWGCQSPCLGSVFLIWPCCQLLWSGCWNKMPENPLSQDLPSASWWLTPVKSPVFLPEEFSLSNHILQCQTHSLPCH